MLLCDDVRPDPNRPDCIHIDSLMSSIVSQENPPYPLLREMICVYLVLTDCHAVGTSQIRVAFIDDEQEQPVFGTPTHRVDFRSVSPLDVVGIPFRIRACRFPRPGMYSVQFWYNGQKHEERYLRLR
jgi:hypothetical protein